MYITPDSLKNMAVTLVAGYKTNGTSLNDSITKVAMDNEMNSEQVKRLVETTNQMAYLSELEGQDDRTFEFEVADYNNILDNLVKDADMTKVASASNPSPMDLISSKFRAPIEKAAADKEASLEKWGKGQKLQALNKVASQQRAILDELMSHEHDDLVKLAQLKATIKRDPEALIKMAKFDNNLAMVKLVFGHDKSAEFDPRVMYREAELGTVKELSDKLSMLKEASEKIADLKPKVEKAEGLLKEAFVAAALSTAGRMISSGISKAPGVAKSIGAKIKTSKPGQTVGKAYTAFDAVDSTNTVGKNTNRNFDAWSSLRG